MLSDMHNQKFYLPHAFSQKVAQGYTPAKWKEKTKKGETWNPGTSKNLIPEKKKKKLLSRTTEQLALLGLQEEKKIQ